MLNINVPDYEPSPHIWLDIKRLWMRAINHPRIGAQAMRKALSTAVAETMENNSEAISRLCRSIRLHEQFNPSRWKAEFTKMLNAHRIESELHNPEGMHAFVSMVHALAVCFDPPVSQNRSPLRDAILSTTTTLLKHLPDDPRQATAIPRGLLAKTLANVLTLVGPDAAAEQFSANSSVRLNQQAKTSAFMNKLRSLFDAIPAMEAGDALTALCKSHLFPGISQLMVNMLDTLMPRLPASSIRDIGCLLATNWAAAHPDMHGMLLDRISSCIARLIQEGFHGAAETVLANFRRCNYPHPLAVVIHPGYQQELCTMANRWTTFVPEMQKLWFEDTVTAMSKLVANNTWRAGECFEPSNEQTIRQALEAYIHNLDPDAAIAGWIHMLKCYDVPRPASLLSRYQPLTSSYNGGMMDNGQLVLIRSMQTYLDRFQSDTPTLKRLLKRLAEHHHTMEFQPFADQMKFNVRSTAGLLPQVDANEINSILP